MALESKGQCSTLEYISSQQMCNLLWGVERSENIDVCGGGDKKWDWSVCHTWMESGKLGRNSLNR